MPRDYLKQFKSQIDSGKFDAAKTTECDVQDSAELTTTQKKYLSVEFQIIRWKSKAPGNVFTKKDIDELKKQLNHDEQNDFFDDPTDMQGLFDKISPKSPERSELPYFPEDLSVVPHLKWSGFKEESEASVQDSKGYSGIDNTQKRLLKELEELELALRLELDAKLDEFKKEPSRSIQPRTKSLSTVNLTYVTVSNACALLRDEYSYLSRTKNESEKNKFKLRISQIKGDFEKQITTFKEIRTKDIILSDTEFLLMVLENEGNIQETKAQKIKRKEKLEAFKGELKMLRTTFKVPATSKWEKAKKMADDVITDLSKPFKKISKEAIRIDNLLKKVNRELKKIEESKTMLHIPKNEGFGLLYEAFEPKKIDLDSFLEALLLFSLQEKDFIESQNIMKLYFEGLTTHELQGLMLKMQSKEMLSLATAFYSQQQVAVNMGFLPEQESQSALTVINEESEEWLLFRKEILQKQYKEKQEVVKITVEDVKKLRVYSELSKEDAEELREKILNPSTKNEVEDFLQRLKKQFAKEPYYMTEIYDELQVKLPQVFGSTELEGYARQKFFEAGASIYSMISSYYIALNREIKERKKTDVQDKDHRTSFSQKYNGLDSIRSDSEKSECFPFSEDVASEWPLDKNGNPLNIKISEKEIQLIQKSVISLISDLSALKNPQQSSFLTTMPESLRERESLTQKKQAHYFSTMMSALGNFFNPNKFIDALNVFHENPQHIEQGIKQMSLDGLNALYKNFQEPDLNDLVLLLRNVKAGHVEDMRDVCEWLSLERKNFPVFNKDFQALAGQLYDSANHLMQAVRTEIIARNEYENKSATSYVSFDEAHAIENFDLKDYSYNSLELVEERIYTQKNAACMRRTLDVYYPRKSDYTVKLSLWDKVCDSVYGFLYPSEKKKLPSNALPYPAVNEAHGNPEISSLSDDGHNEGDEARPLSWRSPSVEDLERMMSGINA